MDPHYFLKLKDYISRTISYVERENLPMRRTSPCGLVFGDKKISVADPQWWRKKFSIRNLSPNVNDFLFFLTYIWSFVGSIIWGVGWGCHV